MSPEMAKILAGVGGSLASETPYYGPFLTAEERDAALAAYRKSFNNARQVSTSDLSGGGVTQSNPGFKSKKQTRSENLPQAYAAYAAETGANPNKSKGYNKDKQFKKWLKERGGEYGLRVKSGKIQGKKTYHPGGFTSQTDPLKETGTAYNQQVLNSMMGLAPMVGQDIAGGLAMRNQIRNMLAQEFANTDADGLTDDDRVDLDAIRSGYMQDIDDDFRDKAQSFVGDMTNRGFGSSSLFNRGLTKNVFDPYSRNLVRANAALASEETTRKNAAAARRQSRVQSILSGANTLGAQNTGNLASTLVNPGAYGGWTDPAAASFGFSQKGAGTAMETDYANNIRNILMTPVMPEQGGFDAGSMLGGAVSGAGAGAMFGPWGAAAGGIIGGIGGSL